MRRVPLPLLLVARLGACAGRPTADPGPGVAVAVAPAEAYRDSRAAACDEAEAP